MNVAKRAVDREAGRSALSKGVCLADSSAGGAFFAVRGKNPLEAGDPRRRASGRACSACWRQKVAPVLRHAAPLAGGGVSAKTSGANAHLRARRNGPGALPVYVTQLGPFALGEQTSTAVQREESRVCVVKLQRIGRVLARLCLNRQSSLLRYSNDYSTVLTFNMFLRYFLL